MTEALNQHDLLFRYLLGMASDTERRAVEEQFFGDDADLDVLLEAEDELIDDYVRGVLSPSDRQLFESNFLCTKKRRERLDQVVSFVEVLAELNGEIPGSSERAGRSVVLEERTSSKSPQADDVSAFFALLNWLDPDLDRAGEKYESIRNRLIKIFASRGFNNTEELADRVFDRVSSKVSRLIEVYVGDPASYIYGVARIEMQSAYKNSALDVRSEAAGADSVASENVYAGFESCLDQLSAPDRDLIMNYYQAERNKVANHKRLAESLGISVTALILRVHKIRKVLRDCIEGRLETEMKQD